MLTQSDPFHQQSSKVEAYASGSEKSSIKRAIIQDNRPYTSKVLQLQALVDNSARTRYIMSPSKKVHAVPVQRVSLIPVIQRAVIHTPGQRGTLMVATDLRVNNLGQGSVPGVDIQGSNEVNAVHGTQGSPFCVRLHMLNGELGGSGNQRSNLGWGSTALNGQHKLRIENDLNAAIDNHDDPATNNQTVIDYYRVRFDYYQPQLMMMNFNHINDIEGSKGAMIEKLYYEARYKSQPADQNFQEKSGMLNDARGIQEMEVLADNHYNNNNNVLAHNQGPTLDLYDTSNNRPNFNAAINGHDQLAGHYDNMILNHQGVVAATARTTRPPLRPADRVARLYMNNQGNYNGTLYPMQGPITRQSFEATVDDLYAHVQQLDERFGNGQDFQRNFVFIALRDYLNQYRNHRTQLTFLP